MAFEILYNTKAVGYGISTALSAVDGTPPYTWAVDPDPLNPQGTIDNNGLYVGGFKTGTDIVTVTDSLSNTAQIQIEVLEPLELFCDIIRNYMSLAPDQVYIYNQKIAPITDSRLYVAIGIANDKYFGNTTKYEESVSGLNEVQSINCKSTLSIDIVSRDDSARNRRSEIVLALNSKYSQNQQELNSFHIGKIPGNFANLSKLEGSAIPFRFNITVNIQFFEKVVREAAFFDVFQGLDLKINK